jgi:hypothetical protein
MNECSVARVRNRYVQYIVKKVSNFNYSRPGRVWLVTRGTHFYCVIFSEQMWFETGL